MILKSGHVPLRGISIARTCTLTSGVIMQEPIGTYLRRFQRPETNNDGSLLFLGGAGSDSNQGLPPQTTALPLLSTSVGPGVVPPASAGLLCLTGSIGRIYTSATFADSLGLGSTEILLNQVPQPFGTVAT